jgi:hypothetical protein
MVDDHLADGLRRAERRGPQGRAVATDGDQRGIHRVARAVRRRVDGGHDVVDEGGEPGVGDVVEVGREVADEAPARARSPLAGVHRPREGDAVGPRRSRHGGAHLVGEHIVVAVVDPSFGGLGRKRRRVAEQTSEQPRFVHARRPQCSGQVLVAAEPPGEGTKVAVGDPEQRSVHAVPRVHPAVLGAAEGLELLEERAGVGRSRHGAN